MNFSDNKSLYGYSDSESTEKLICPRCEKEYYSDSFLSPCPKCGYNIVNPYEAIKDLPKVGSSLHFFNSPVTAKITGYFMSDETIMVLWSSDKPVYNSEFDEETNGMFDISFLNTYACLDKTYICDELYEVEKTSLTVATNEKNLSGTEFLYNERIFEIVDEEPYCSSRFDVHDNALSKYNELLKTVQSSYCGQRDDGKYIYKVDYVTLSKCVATMPVGNGIESEYTLENEYFPEVKAD